jgi:hypothetical protein
LRKKEPVLCKKTTEDAKKLCFKAPCDTATHFDCSTEDLKKKQPECLKTTDPTNTGGTGTVVTPPPKPIDNSKSSDLVHFNRMMGNWSWTTQPADSTGHRKREGFVVFHENGTCTLHYEEHHWSTKAPLGEPDVYNDMVWAKSEEAKQPGFVTSNTKWDYCSWAVNMRAEPFKLYIDWHMEKPIHLLQERKYDTTGKEIKPATGVAP